ncbi:hypothetical protein ACL9RL_16125 [Plantibacter sp. Mn2098]|uniref:hypothetical protein n=1 Tax=Plantibacter sp. Mn2098 TaxID=3395266 RepID=UPI003BBFFC12
MGFLDRLLGRDDRDDRARTQAGYGAGAPQPGYGSAATPSAPQSAPRSADEIAVERYRYLLRTAPPEAIEQVHAEAFAKLTPEQRTLVFQELSQNAPAGDAPLNDSPAALATAATRSELRQPGTLERSFGQRGPGLGTMFAGSLLGTISGMVIGSAIASAFIPDSVGTSADGAGADGAGTDGSGADGSGAGTDGGSIDAAGADQGGGFGDSGWGGGNDAGGGFGDFGGGDFGGDFGF